MPKPSTSQTRRGVLTKLGFLAVFALLTSCLSLLLCIPLYLLPSLGASKLHFVCLRGLILLVEGEVRVRLTSSDLGRMRFLCQGVPQGLSLGGEEKNSLLLLSTFKPW
jgi:hypothetical protein